MFSWIPSPKNRRMAFWPSEPQSNKKALILSSGVFRNKWEKGRQLPHLYLRSRFARPDSSTDSAHMIYCAGG